MCEICVFENNLNTLKFDLFGVSLVKENVFDFRTFNSIILYCISNYGFPSSFKIFMKCLDVITYSMCFTIV